ALAQAWQEHQKSRERRLGGRELIAGRSALRHHPRPFAERARVGIALRVGPEPGAVAEYAGRLAVPYAVHGRSPRWTSIRPPSANVKAGTIVGVSCNACATCAPAVRFDPLERSGQETCASAAGQVAQVVEHVTEN